MNIRAPIPGCLIPLALALWCPPGSPAIGLESRPGEFADFFKKGDTVAFLGDSLTHGGDYHILIQTFFSTRYPEMDLWTENVGRAGDTSWGALRERLEGDLYRFEPDVVFLHFGMNDAGRDTFKGMKEPPSDMSRAERRGRYRTAMTKLVDALLTQKMKVAIISPTIFDDGMKRWDSQHESPQLNAELVKFGEMGQELATEKGLPFVDVHTPLARLTEEQQAKDETFSFTADRVHPTNGGYPIMAWEILKDLGVDPIVYDVRLSAAGGGSVKEAKQAAVSDVKMDSGALTWTAKETRLPFPVTGSKDDKGFALVSFQETLNRMMLRVEDLPAGKYSLKIDGSDVAEFDAKELAAGVNMAGNAKTPQNAAALKLRTGLIAEKGELQETLRDLNSYLLSTKSDAAKDPAVKNVDWDDVETVIAVRDYLVEAKKAQGQDTGAYYGHITNQGKKHLAKLPEMRARLVEIRKELEALPESRSHTYQLAPAE